MSVYCLVPVLTVYLSVWPRLTTDRSFNYMTERRLLRKFKGTYSKVRGFH